MVREKLRAEGDIGCKSECQVIQVCDNVSDRGMVRADVFNLYKRLRSEPMGITGRSRRLLNPVGPFSHSSREGIYR